MKRRDVNILIMSFLLLIFFISIGITSIALAQFTVESPDPVSVEGGKKITWKVEGKKTTDTFKDFHVATGDGVNNNYDNWDRPLHWTCRITPDNNGNPWISCWGTSAIQKYDFSVRYKAKKKVEKKSGWRVTNDGDENPDTGIIKPGGEGGPVYAPTAVDFPTFTQWGLIGLMLVLLALATWVFFWRRKVVDVRS